ncbi:DegT/DnrJ/EryC1/StrS family aminotransferase [Chloroflexota bacterium]
MIPVNEPLFIGKEKEYLNQCIDQAWISSEGTFVKRFEEGFSSYVGVKYGVAVCNGTAALEVAVAAAGLGEGDEVIMPAFTIISCALGIIRPGAKPVLVDAEPETWNMDTGQIESRITEKTKAIMVVHTYGHPVDMDPVMDLACKYRLKIIEDAAEVHGAEYKGRKAGSIGHVGCFSFYANKIITSGEGGMVVTSDETIAERSRAYRNLCFRPEKRFYHTEIGYNFRMTNLQAAIAFAQLEHIDKLIQIKRRNAMLYSEWLRDIGDIKLPVEKEWAKNVYWMYGIELKDRAGMDNEELARMLQAKGVDTRLFFFGMHEQPVFHKMGLFEGEHYPVAERLARRGLYLPSGLALRDEQIETVCKALHDILGR